MNIDRRCPQLCSSCCTKKKKKKKKYIIFTTKIVIYINNLLYNAAKRYLFSKRRAHNISVKASAGANYGR